jgi:predicted nucleic acid-binding Zn ribbon protein
MKGKPQPIADVLSRLLSRRGYAQERSAAACVEAWRSAAGDAVARQSRAGGIRGGVLEVLTANSTLVQELTFQKQELLKKLTELLPDQPIRDLRFRVGRIE